MNKIDEFENEQNRFRTLQSQNAKSLRNRQRDGVLDLVFLGFSSAQAVPNTSRPLC